MLPHSHASRYAVSQRDPGSTVQAFINLVQRHEQAAYSFVHNVHAKGEDLFGSLLQWIQLFIDTIREGVNSEPLSLDFLLPQSSTERKLLLEEVDKVTKYHYQLKLMYEDKIRKRFNRADIDSALGGGADADDEAAQLLVTGLVGDVGFGELVRSDVNDVAAEESDDSEDYTSSEYESATEGSLTSDSETEESSEDEPTPSSNLKVSPRVPVSSGLSPRHARPQQQVRTSNMDSIRDQSSSPNTEGSSRKRGGLSLKRSLGFLKSSSSPSQASPPPVPPVPTMVPPITSQHPPPRLPALPSLPAETLSLPVDKDLPPPPSSPSGEGSSQPPPPSSSISTPPPAPAPKKTRKRKHAKAPKQPELEHIPKLVPVFVEMVRELDTLK